jgi:hypothetical protein
VSLLKLNANAFTRLKAQLNLNGTFNHTLRNAKHVSMQLTVAVEQCSAAIHVQVSTGHHQSCVTLDRANRANAIRVARFIEAVANGYPFSGAPDDAEYSLASGMEIMLRTAIRKGRGTHYLQVEDLDDLHVCLRQGCTGALIATIEADDVALKLLLPRDAAKAYSMLASNVEQFIAGHRAALAA